MSVPFEIQYAWPLPTGSSLIKHGVENCTSISETALQESSAGLSIVGRDGRALSLDLLSSPLNPTSVVSASTLSRGRLLLQSTIEDHDTSNGLTQHWLHVAEGVSDDIFDATIPHQGNALV